MTGERGGSSGWPPTVLVTGAAGFIGSNLVRHLAATGVDVVGLDDLSRPGSRLHADRLRAELGSSVRLVEADVVDSGAVEAAVAGVDAVVHLAGQTAVTHSISDPRRDFLANCVGTFNVLEAARRSRRDPIVLYASTNKVYGALEHVRIVEEVDHYRFADLPGGIDESHPLDFHSPYACSRGAGEQYVVDYARTYGLRTVVFRQSCIYGEHQLGVEDQGWVAWFLMASRAGRTLSIFGDGKQVRDLLHVDDLVACFRAGVERIDVAAGRVYNVGGGAANAVSVWWQLRPLLEDVLERELPTPEFAPWRPGDQRVFIADTARAADELGWRPTIAPATGIRRLASWLEQTSPLPAT